MRDAALDDGTGAGVRAWGSLTDDEQNEDFGDKHIPGSWPGVSTLFRSGAWPTPVAVAGAADAGKADALACYRSQLLALEADWSLATKLPAAEQLWRRTHLRRAGRTWRRPDTGPGHR
jgi:hypothetical protein